MKTQCNVCGAEPVEWESLEWIGDQPDPPLILELRNCPCGGTHARLKDPTTGEYVESHPLDTEGN